MSGQEEQDGCKALLCGYYNITCHLVQCFLKAFHFFISGLLEEKTVSNDNSIGPSDIGLKGTLDRINFACFYTHSTFFFLLQSIPNDNRNNDMHYFMVNFSAVILSFKKRTLPIVLVSFAKNCSHLKLSLSLKWNSLSQHCALLSALLTA